MGNLCKGPDTNINPNVGQKDKVENELLNFDE